VHLQVRGLRPVIGDVLRRFNDRGERSAAEWRATLDRHKLVLRAIEARDPEGAERAMFAHFEAADAAIAEIYGGATREGRE
jgi:GntR family transcriptional repressor for pyruvate dehydrogenase complex